ncbi:MAG TPA: putative DNA-binding domain-containing protein [Rhodoferax sp.]|jgi:hypothetical protein|nr:putative DNA-binding domain-containing protein [Rhodoferax sp.]HPW30330.1 putative DNA-binding domain-containing protein [Rhodoferax sp.]
MSALARQQQALLDALLAWPSENAMKNIASYVEDTRSRGLKAYQTNGHALAERALAAAYPVLAQIVGDESFADLARALWHAQPPLCGDVACWGGGLAAFVRASAQLKDVPYLGDVARAEWALHQCASAADGAADLQTLALLTTHDPQQLRLQLSPGCAVVRSAWPVASILTAHRDGSPSFEQVGEMLRVACAQDAVVWRCGLRPGVRLAVKGETELLLPLLRGESLAEALDAAHAVDFSQWLPMAVQSGLLLSVRREPEVP